MGSGKRISREATSGSAIGTREPGWVIPDELESTSSQDIQMKSSWGTSHPREPGRSKVGSMERFRSRRLCRGPTRHRSFRGSMGQATVRDLVASRSRRHRPCRHRHQLLLSRPRSSSARGAERNGPSKIDRGTGVRGARFAWFVISPSYRRGLRRPQRRRFHRRHRPVQQPAVRRLRARSQSRKALSQRCPSLTAGRCRARCAISTSSFWIKHQKTEPQGISMFHKAKCLTGPSRRASSVSCA